MVLAAGITILTIVAKRGCVTAKVCAALAELSAGGVWAQTSGDMASVAPSPNPRTATRAFFNQGWRKTSAGCCIIKGSPAALMRSIGAPATRPGACLEQWQPELSAGFPGD